MSTSIPSSSSSESVSDGSHQPQFAKKLVVRVNKVPKAKWVLSSLESVLLTRSIWFSLSSAPSWVKPGEPPYTYKFVSFYPTSALDCAYMPITQGQKERSDILTRILEPANQNGLGFTSIITNPDIFTNFTINFILINLVYSKLTVNWQDTALPLMCWRLLCHWEYTVQRYDACDACLARARRRHS